MSQEVLMKKRLMFILLVVNAGCLFAFEPGALNLKVPSNLDKNSLVFDVKHRAYGVLTDGPLDNFFGLDRGANVSIGVRYAMLPRMEINASYSTGWKEYVVGLSYAHHFPQIYLKGQVDVQYFDFERADERNGNFYYGLALQSFPLGGVLTPTLNVAYDGFNEKFGMGFGLDAGFDWEFGPVKHISLIGEYYPVLQAEDNITYTENYFAAGLRMDTYGHHFMFQISNGSEISTRRLMLGSPTNDLYLGFNIHRILRF
jgi:hypothetical protein